MELQAKHDLVALGESAGPRPEELANLEERTPIDLYPLGDPLLKSRTQASRQGMLIREEVFTLAAILKQFASVLRKPRPSM